MKITVEHNFDDVNLAEGISEARNAPGGARAAVLSVLNGLLVLLSVSSLVVALSSFLFDWPVPGVAIRWVALLNLALAAVTGCFSFLSARFAERLKMGPTGVVSVTYELQSDGLSVTSEAGRVLWYWSPGSAVENDSQRLFITCGPGAILVIPARAFATYADFESFEATAKALVKAAGEAPH